jgi:hypothetical protein
MRPSKNRARKYGMIIAAFVAMIFTMEKVSEARRPSVTARHNRNYARTYITLTLHVL